MDKINHRGVIYNVISIVMFSDSIHLIIQHNDSVEYINKVGNKFLIPSKDLSPKSNPHTPLSELRKQYLLSYLIEYIRNNGLYTQDKLKKVIYAFKEFIKLPLVKTFIYWPSLSDQDFYDELQKVLNGLDVKLHNSLLEIGTINNIN